MKSKKKRRENAKEREFIPFLESISPHGRKVDRKETKITKISGLVTPDSRRKSPTDMAS